MGCFTGFNLDPNFENHVRELELGEKPSWVPLHPIDHIACRRTCSQCFLDDDLTEILINIHKNLKIRREQLFILIMDENTDREHRQEIRRIFKNKIGYDVVFNIAFDVPAVILIQNKGTILDSFFNGATKAFSRLILFTPSNDEILRAAARDRKIQVKTLDNFIYVEPRQIGPITLLGLAEHVKPSSEYDIPKDSDSVSVAEIHSDFDQLQPEIDPEAYDFDNSLEQSFPRPRTQEDELDVEHIKRNLHHDLNLFID